MIITNTICRINLCQFCSIMHLGTLSAALLVLAQTLVALPAETNQQLGLSVMLSKIGNTRIKAVVGNTGQEMTYTHLNFFGDNAPVKKIAVYQNSTNTSS